MILALLSPPELPDGPVTNAANSLIQAGVLGALVVLMGIALAVVVLKWNKTQEARVKEHKELSKALTDLTVGLQGALGDLTGMVNAQTDAMKANTSASVSMERTLNEVIREAVRSAGYRRYSPPGGTSSSPPPGGR